MSDLINRITFDYASLDEAFPEVDPGVEPYGSRVLVQIRTPKKKTAGGIHLISDARETEYWVAQVAKVRAIGPVAFRNRNTMEQWPEKDWAAPGDYVRVPKHGGDRWSVTLPDGDECMFIVFNDLDLIGKITGDPRTMKSYL